MLRGVQTTQDRGEVLENLGPGSRRREVQTAGGLVHLVRPLQGVAVGQSSFSSEPARQLSVRERGEQPDHRHRDVRGLHTRHDGLCGPSCLAVEPEDEAGRHDHAVRIEPMDTLHDGVPGVLLLLGAPQELFVGCLDPDEDIAEVHGFHHREQLWIVRQVDGRLGAEVEGEAALPAPREQLRQERHHGLLVTDEVVVHEIYVPSVAQTVEAIQFPEDLRRRLRAGLPAVELDEVAELAVERAAAGELDPDVEIPPQLQQVESRGRALGDVGLVFGAIDSVRGSSLEVAEELRDRQLPLIEHQVIRGGVNVRLACGILAADGDALATGVTEVDESQEAALLRDHAAGHDKVRPLQKPRIHLADVEIEEPDLPLLGQECRDRDEAEWGRRIPSAEELADFAVVPVAEFREARGNEQAARHRGLVGGGLTLDLATEKVKRAAVTTDYSSRRRTLHRQPLYRAEPDNFFSQTTLSISHAISPGALWTVS